MAKELWEILVPAQEWVDMARRYEDWPLEHHKKWDDEVKQIAGGLTIMHSVKGRWQEDDEPMIPVRIACTENEILQIAAMTAEHYNQREVMFYQLSSKVFFFQRGLKRC